MWSQLWHGDLIWLIWCTSTMINLQKVTKQWITISILSIVWQDKIIVNTLYFIWILWRLTSLSTSSRFFSSLYIRQWGRNEHLLSLQKFSSPCEAQSLIRISWNFLNNRDLYLDQSLNHWFCLIKVPPDLEMVKIKIIWTGALSKSIQTKL